MKKITGLATMMHTDEKITKTAKVVLKPAKLTIIIIVSVIFQLNIL